MKPPSFTAEELLAHCRPAGVGRVNLIQMSFYEFDNRYMLDMIKLYPDRFVGTAIVDPLGADPGKAMRDLLPKGVRAFRIQPQYSKQPPARWLEPPGYAAMFATAARDRPGAELPDRPRRLRRGRPDVPAFPTRPSSSTTSAGSAATGRRSATPTSMRSATWPSIRRSTSRSGPSTPWARRRRRTSTSPR